MENAIDEAFLADLVADCPDTWWQDQRVCRCFARFFAKYILALDVACRIGGHPRWETLTGLLVQRGGMSFWFTAAHVLDYRRTLLGNGSCETLRAWWFDGCEIKGAERIPVDLPSLATRSAKCPTDVFDIGVVVLSKNERELLMAGGKHEFATERWWRALDAGSPIGHYLVGFPAEWQEFQTISETPQGTLVEPRRELACVPVREIAKDPQGEPADFWTPSACIFGQALPYSATDDLFLNSIKGTSGGPLFSVEIGGPKGFRFRLHGIQSAWLPERRILRAVRMDVGASLSDDLVNSIRQTESSE